MTKREILFRRLKREAERERRRRRRNRAWL
jgi:hypothetical protein